MWRRLRLAWRWMRGDPEVHLYDGPEFVDIDRLRGRSSYELTADVTRRMLGSVTLEDARHAKPMREDRIRAFEVHMGAIFKDFVEPRLTRLLIAQQELMSLGSEEMRQLHRSVRDQIVYGRGSINGIMLVYEEFREAFDAYMSRSSGTEPFDKYKLFPELYADEGGGIKKEKPEGQ